MGTLVLDDLADDPRIEGTRTEAPGDSSRGREDAGEPPATAADSRDGRRPEQRDERRRAR